MTDAASQAGDADSPDHLVTGLTSCFQESMYVHQWYSIVCVTVTVHH